MPHQPDKTLPASIKTRLGRSAFIQTMLGLARQEWLGVAIIIVIGAWLRAYGLFWDWPEFFNPDEGRLIKWGREFNYLDPVSSEWGALPLLLSRLMAALVSPFARPGEEYLYPIARSLSVVIGCATILLVYLLARRGYSRLTALYAAIFTTFTVLLIQDGHFYSLDGIFGLLVLAALFSILTIAQTGRRRSYLWAGVIIGLAVATRINGYLLLLPLLAAHYSHSFRHPANQRPGWKPVHLIKPLFSQNLWLAGILSVAVFLLLTPALILDTKNFLFHDGLVWVLLQTAGYLKSRYTLQFEGTTPVYYFTNLLFWSAGPALLLAYLAGIIYGLVKWRHAANVIILAFALIYLWAGAEARVKFIRYSLPLLPLFNILAAAFFAAAPQKLNGSALKHGLTAWLGLTVVGTGLYALAFTTIYAGPDTRLEAARWVQANIPAGAVVVRESGDYPSVVQFGDEHLPQYQLREINFDRLYESSQPALESKMPAVFSTWGLPVSRRGKEEAIPDDDFTPLTDYQKWQHIQETLHCADYIVFTERNYDLYHNRPQLFPVEHRYYTQLFNGELGFQPVKTFSRKPQLFGRQIDDSPAELTFRLFDHPTVWVFQSQLPPEFFDNRPPQVSTEANWEGKVLLAGYDLDPNAVRPGQNIQLRLYWAVLADIRYSNYTIFVHLLDSNGQMVAQSDHQVGDGILPTSCWRPGRVIVDQISLPLPAQTSPGLYRLNVGLYSTNTLERLALANDAGGENAYPLAQIQIVK